MTASTLIRAGQFAQVARQGAVLLVALALPRLGVDLGLIGEWEGLLYVGYVLGFGWLSGVFQAYLVTVRSARDTNYYSRKVLVAVFGASALLLALAAGLHEGLFQVLRLGSPPQGWWWFFVFLLLQWPGMFFEQVLQLRGRAWELVGFASFSAMGFAISVLLPLYFGSDLETALRYLAAYSGLRGAIMLAWLLYDQRQGRGARTQVPSSEQKEPSPNKPTANGGLHTLWVTARPLILYATINGLVTAFDPWFVNYWFEDDESLFAIFRYGVRDIPFVTAVIGGMVVMVIPQLTEHLSMGLSQLRDSSRRLLHLIFGGALLLMITAQYWWVPLLTEMFAEGLPLFRLYLFVIISRLLFPTPILVALGHTRGLWLFSLGELLLNAVLSLILAPEYGLYGIVLATVISDIFVQVTLLYYLYRKTGIRPGRYLDLRWFLGYSLALLFAYYLL